MIKLPKITRLCRAPNFPDNIEIDLEWEGEYKTMLTFHKDDFSNGRADIIIKAHVGMVKREIMGAEMPPRASFAKALYPGIEKYFKDAYKDVKKE